MAKAPKIPDEPTGRIWIALSRAGRRAVTEIERALKDAGLPPLAWYDALWELEKAGPEGLRPFELERAMLFEQYNLSRLADRLMKAGHVVRHAAPEDGRGHRLAITPAGRDIRRRMWAVYGPAIASAIGGRLDDGDAETLAALLGKLA
jgi:DNA-binding MarR family transcriptional regulator